jgi:hypothetical protein
MQSTPKIILDRLFEKTSAKGTLYFTSQLGPARLILFWSREDADDSTPIWDMFLQESNAPQPDCALCELLFRDPSW